MNRVILAVLLGVGLVVGGVLGVTDRRPPPPVEPLAQQTISDSSLAVHVAGWVVRPGVVNVPEGSIAADAVEAAGGLRPGASVELVNLAAPLRSGDQLVIPGPEATVDDPDGPLPLNRASASDLEDLPGVGPVLAERIVSYRDQHGAFQQVEDLLQVPGIGEAKLSSIRDLVKVP